MSRDAWELAYVDAVGQAELVRRGDVSPAELTAWAIERIETLNPVLNAVITPMLGRAVDAAATVDPDAPLAGVPFLVKDLIVEIEGVRFTEGSRFLGERVSTFTSELVLRLQRAGVVVAGKTNTPEFG